ncbi:hypothetical protein F2Q68_00007085 [Brassica cretica]|nr:hypothetical protein F2Q68_00007085 [Brassica cretica]
MLLSNQQQAFIREKLLKVTTTTRLVLQNLRFHVSLLVSFQAKDMIREFLNWALIRCAISPELSDFYEFGGGPEAAGSRGGNDNRYLECKAIGDHLEFESFQVKGLARRENFLDKSIQE